MRLSKKMNSVSLFMRMKMKHRYIPVVEKEILAVASPSLA